MPSPNPCVGASLGVDGNTAMKLRRLHLNVVVLPFRYFAEHFLINFRLTVAGALTD